MLFLEIPIAYIILACCVVIPIFVLLIVAFIIAIVKRVKLAKKYNPKKNKVDEGKQALLLEAFGEDNIISAAVEMSRLTVEVKDVDKVNTDKIKEAGANGVLLVGNKVKCSFGEQASEVCNLLQNK